MKIAYQISTGDVRRSLSLTSYHASLEDCFARLGENGYDRAELMVRDPAAIDPSEVERLSRRHGLEVPMVCTGEIGGAGLTFSSLDDAVRGEALTRALRSVDLAAALGAQVNVGRLRGQLHPDAPGRSRERSVGALRRLCAHAREKGVLVALEPINSIGSNFINTVRQGLELLEEMDSENARLMLDVQHMYLDEPDMFAAVGQAGRVLSYVHVMGSNRLYPGMGSRLLDLGRFVETLRAHGYEGYLGVEVFQRPDQDTALRESARAMRELLGAV